MIITVDCGTTNMRIRLYDNNILLYEQKRKAGGRNTAFSGSSEYLRSELKAAIDELLEDKQLGETDIEIILCTGILSSDVGIYHIPHATAPCGVRESALSAQIHYFTDITSIPFLLIPGVKTIAHESETNAMKVLESLESMSGEECEIYGIMERLGLRGDFIIALPGSYNKVMKINSDGQIMSISTGMCGEMIAAMSEHTVLKKTLPSPVIRELIPEMLIAGFDFAREHGMSPSLIKSRMMVTMGGYTLDQAANFFVGVLLVDDIMSCARQYTKGVPFVVGGTYPLRDVFSILLRHGGVDNIIEVDDTLGKLAPSIGAMKVWSYFSFEKEK